MGLKWDIEKFSDSNDYGLWKVKMQEVLKQQKFAFLNLIKMQIWLYYYSHHHFRFKPPTLTRSGSSPIFLIKTNLSSLTFIYDSFETLEIRSLSSSPPITAASFSSTTTIEIGVVYPNKFFLHLLNFLYLSIET